MSQRACAGDGHGGLELLEAPLELLECGPHLGVDKPAVHHEHNVVRGHVRYTRECLAAEDACTHIVGQGSAKGHKPVSKQLPVEHAKGPHVRGDRVLLRVPQALGRRPWDVNVGNLLAQKDVADLGHELGADGRLDCKDVAGSQVLVHEAARGQADHAVGDPNGQRTLVLQRQRLAAARSLAHIVEQGVCLDRLSE